MTKTHDSRRPFLVGTDGRRDSVTPRSVSIRIHRQIKRIVFEAPPTDANRENFGRLFAGFPAFSMSKLRVASSTGYPGATRCYDLFRP